MIILARREYAAAMKSSKPHQEFAFQADIESLDVNEIEWTGAITPFSMKETEAAIMTQKPVKAPGLDGIPSDLYKSDQKRWAPT
ncbi:hypothetical protein NDU88_000530 [Pleurodeles waltl]|uniref:Uncharacterized protein n=1 Tax=Pleurodeles waltl TaxID=8319 RepID=A0AAV7TH15_PLEWA|nr:hypothetical protein NDU88_000530 [Pleurodeles waltl]